MGDRVILHSDINCCYASIEHLHHPELAGKPLAVGGDPEARHGIVLTADYIAKKYGVKTGMALWQAKEVCPDITFVSPRMDLYLRFSRMAHEIYAEYTDRQEPYGIDECWLDVTGSSSLKGDGLLIAQEISRRMKSELGITVSVGVSFNKICTTWIEPPDYEQFIYELLNTPRRARAVRSQYYNTGIQVHLNKMSMEWFIENKSMDKHSVAATKTYGTSRMDAYSIFEDTLNLKTVTVRDRIDDGDGKYHYEVNKNETMLASGT